jgi:hypothetical protein
MDVDTGQSSGVAGGELADQLLCMLPEGLKGWVRA